MVPIAMLAMGTIVLIYFSISLKTFVFGCSSRRELGEVRILGAPQDL